MAHTTSKAIASQNDRTRPINARATAPTGDTAVKQGVGAPGEHPAQCRHQQSTDDLGAGDDGCGQSRHPVGGGVAVQLQQVGLHGVEGVEATPR